MTDQDPRHGLEAIALLAHLYADEDGHHGPDPVRDILAEESALALVSCALDLLAAAECDVPTGTKGAARRIRKAIRLLEDTRDRLHDGVRLRMVERIVGSVEWSAPVPKSEPGTPEAVTAGTAALTDLMRTPAVGSIYGDVDWEKIPVGTVAVVPSGTVYVRCHKGWDIASVLGGWSTPDLHFSTFPPDCATLIHIGDGTIPDDYAEVRRIVEAHWQLTNPAPPGEKP